MTKENEPKNLDSERIPRTLMDTIQKLEKENEALRQQLWKYKRKPTAKIGYLLLLIGVIPLVWSIMYTSQVSAFIGIALTFWGALLLFIRPVKYMKTELLSPTTFPIFATINLIVQNINYKGKGMYLPPNHFKGIENERLFISLKENVDIPPAEEMAPEEVFLKNPQGICLTPSGLELANLFEEELGADFSEVDVSFLQRNLPKLFVEGLEIAESCEMNVRGNMFRLNLWNSIYKDFCNKARKLSKDTCSSFACPLCSSIACALTRLTGKPVIITKSKVTSNGENLRVYYQVLED